MHKQRCWFPWVVALLVIALTAGATGALPRLLGGEVNEPTSARAHRNGGPESPIERPNTLEPIVGPTSWSDELNDALGLSWLDQTQLLTDRIRLSLVEVLGEDVSAVTAMTEGPGGVLYLGTTQARLWSYDPATDTTTDLGLPVPGECDN